jgi:hypothetical protein
MLVFLLIVGAFAVGAGRGTAVARSAKTCQPPDATTLLAGRSARIYSRPSASARPQGREQLFGCLVATERSRKLQTPRRPCVPQQCAGGTVRSRPLAIHAPWVAFPEAWHHRDGLRLAIVSKNLYTGRTRFCWVGGAYGAPKKRPAVTDLALQRDGYVAWVGVRRVANPPPSGGPQNFPPGTTAPPEPSFIPYSRQKQVVDCDKSGEVILDSGVQINLHTLVLDGQTLTWIKAGQKRSSRIP